MIYTSYFLLYNDLLDSLTLLFLSYRDYFTLFILDLHLLRALSFLEIYFLCIGYGFL